MSSSSPGAWWRAHRPLQTAACVAVTLAHLLFLLPVLSVTALTLMLALTTGLEAVVGSLPLLPTVARPLLNVALAGAGLIALLTALLQVWASRTWRPWLTALGVVWGIAPAVMLRVWAL